MAYDLIKISGLPLVTPDSGQDIVVGVGDYAKRINYGAVKADMVGTSPTYTTDTEPYLMRQTAHVGVVGKCALNKLVGGSLGWNQLCNGSSVTVPSGHKYYMKKSGTASIGASTGSALTGLTSGTDMVIDLTVMFGSTIADYVYGLGSASGITWLARYIDLGTYHAYDAGSIQSIQATAHVTTGFNQWDEVWESGQIDSSGNPSSSSSRIRSVNFIPVIGGETYYLRRTTASNFVCSYYDGSQNFISQSGVVRNTPFTIPDNCRYMKIVLVGATTLEGEGVCFNISKTTGSPKNGDYVPYSAHTYPLGSDTLRGVPQLVSNKLAFDGDIKTPDGTIRRRYGIVDLGTLTWNIGSSGTYRRFYSTETGTVKRPTSQDDVINVLALPYKSTSLNSLLATDKTIAINTTGAINIADSAYASSTAAQFKAAMSGVYMVYPVAVETTESSSAYQRIQTIDADGTESFTTSTPVPVGHETQTADNVLAEIDAICDGLDDIDEEKAVAIPDSAFTLESGVTITTNSLFKYRNMVVGTIVFNLSSQQTTSRTIATIATPYRPLVIQRAVIGSGLQAYQVQEVGYGAINEQGEVRLTQQSTGKPYAFYQFSYITA